MNTITNITISNIKGFGEQNNSIDLELKPNKVNLLIAPNGFGKTSIAKGFEAINRNRLDLSDELLHHEQVQLLPAISLKYNGETLTANKTANTISTVFDITVINSGLKATSHVQTYQGRVIQRATLDVESIILRSSVPQRQTIDYKITEIRADFVKNANLLRNISHLICKSGIAGRIIDAKDLFYSIPKRLVTRLQKFIECQVGTLRSIISNIDENGFDEIEQIEQYREIQKLFADFLDEDVRLERFTLFYQLNWLLSKKRSNLKSVYLYESYVNQRDMYNNIIQSVDSTGRNLKAIETRGKLVVSFPRADTMSNGQRDIITFITSLMKFRLNYNSQKKQILIIDEVFDYLDDANIITAQYFLSSLLSESRDNLYLIIFSHLAESNFRGWVFNKKLNIQYIKPSIAIPSPQIKTFIAYRGILKKEKSKYYNQLSDYYFHYHPHVSSIDLSPCYREKENLKKNWFSKTALHEYIIGELNKYLEDQSEYDPYAVCMGLRYRCEKTIYDQLSSEDEKRYSCLRNKKQKTNLSGRRVISIMCLLFTIFCLLFLMRLNI